MKGLYLRGYLIPDEMKSYARKIGRW